MGAIFNEQAAATLLSEGNIDAFDFYYHNYHQSVYANIIKIVQVPQSAEDILQDVFLAFWENRNKFTGQASVAGWLFVVSYNKSLSFLKKKLKESTILLEDASVVDRLMEAPVVDEDFYQKQLEILERAVSTLPERKQKVFRLCRFEGKSVEEAANILGISSSSVRDYLKQSSRLLRQYVQKEHASELALLGLLVVSLSL
ncbi:RNA polymerase sigma factor [Taibaiella koreensis]|uniref:RNA polymerase sigma factor n=1 Tax=Taibaiella koreensis TaxID=1268548 RepID=UPI000E59E0D9|nr:sigma-70 family RNA polymerase sigma factor [Taibaiella koreensis]